MSHSATIPARHGRGLTQLADAAVSFLLLALALSLFSGIALAQAPKICIPPGGGVPGSGGSPDWWTPNQQTNTGDDNVFAYQPFDPRWEGAYSLDYGDGSISQVDFRGLYDEAGGQQYLLLSWRVKSTAQFSVDNTTLYAGFYSPAADEGSLLRIVLRDTSTGADAAFPGLPAAAAMAPGNPLFSATLETGSGDDPAQWTTPASPAWLSDTLRVWIEGQTNPYNWTVQVRIPLGAAGLNLDPTDFKIWSYVQEAVLLAEGAIGIVPYTWPRPPSGDALQYASYQQGINQVYPQADDWGDFALVANPAADPTCPGVDITSSRIGTRNAVSSQIELTADNTFFAEPENKTSAAIPDNVLSATFRIANWGSQVGDTNSASWAAPAALTNVTTGPGGTGAPVGGFATIEGTWNPSDDPAGLCPFVGNPTSDPTSPCAPGSAPTRMLHQCMLVELTGPGLNFIRNSVYRNMDFVGASLFERDAEISVVGLSDHPAGKRDVFLYVERRNMPAYHDDGAPSSKPSDTLPQRDGQDRRIAAAVAAAPAVATAPPDPSADPPAGTNEPATDALPTWTVHAYHDTGQTIRLADGEHRVLLPQTSFGYYLSHEGPLLGWSDRLDGAERLREDLYRVAPANDSAVVIKTLIQAVEPGDTAIGEPWPPKDATQGFGRVFWIILLVLVVLFIWRRWLS